VLPTIQASIIRQKEADAETGYAQALTAEAAKNGLAKTAAAHHLDLVTTPSLNSQGVIAGLPDGSKVIAKAFAAKQGAAPENAPTGEGYAIFQVVNVTPPHAPAFADWKPNVAKDYADEKLPALLAQKTAELAAKAKSSGDLAKAAKEVGASFKTSDLVGESGQVPDLGQVGSVAPQLFDLAVGAISGPITAQRTGVVAKLLDKQEPSADEIAKNLDQTREQTLEQRREEVFNVYVSSTEDRYKKAKLIAINAKAAREPAIPGQ
jgi:peptidyl-prolyl cis-trans isomerase D